MTKSELIERLAESQSQLTAKDMELAVKLILDQMADSLARGERIEARRLSRRDSDSAVQDRTIHGQVEEIGALGRCPLRRAWRSEHRQQE